MFTPAGEKSRAARATRRPRLGATDQPAIPIAGPPSYSYGSPSPGRTRQVSQGPRESPSDIDSTASESKRHRNSQDQYWINESAINEGNHQNEVSDRRTPRKKNPSLQDIEASINRRQSLRSSSRSVGRGSPSVASSQDLTDIKRESQQVNLDYDVTQSSISRSYDESQVLRAQLDYPSENTYIDDDSSDADYTQDRPITYQEVDTNQAGALRRTTNYMSENMSVGWIFMSQLKKRVSSKIRGILGLVYTTISKLMHFGMMGRKIASLAALIIALALPVLFFGLPQFLPTTVQRTSYTVPYLALPDTTELLDRVTSLETYLSRYSQAVSNLEKDFDTLKPISTMAKEKSEQAMSRSGEAQEHVNEVSKKLSAIDETLRRLKNSQVVSTKDIETLTRDVKSLEDKTKTHSHDLEQYMRTGLEHDKELHDLRKSVAFQEKSIQHLAEAKKDSKNSEELESFVFSSIERALPEKLIVSLRSGHTQSTAEFWQYLSTVFMKRDEFNNGSIPKRTGSQGWNDAADLNTADIKKFIEQSVTDIWGRAGEEEAIVSRAYFMDLIRKEWSSLVEELEHRMTATEETAKKAETIAYDASKHSEDGSRSPKFKLHPNTENDAHFSTEQVIRRAIHKYSLDTLASPDYAAYTSGARINPFLTSSTYLHRPTAIVPRIFSRVFFNVGSSWSHPPAVAIHPSNAVGMCWAFPGNRGQLSVKLSHRIVLTDVAVEHVHPDIAHDASTAPKDIEIWAYVGEDAHIEASPIPFSQATAGNHVLREAPAAGFVHIMDVVYNVFNGEQAVQTFAVPTAFRKLNVSVNQVVYRIKSNWGNNDFTCLYRVRAIGRPETTHESEAIDRDEDM